MSRSRDYSWDYSWDKRFLWRILSGGDYSWDYSRDKVAFLKCHCSVLPDDMGISICCWNGLWGPFGIETGNQGARITAFLLLEWLVGPVRD